MTYTPTKQTNFITDEALLSIRRQYMQMKLRAEAAEKTAEKLIKLDAERDKLFQMLNEQFDILFGENEDLAATLVIRENRILELEQEAAGLKKRLELLKKKKRGLRAIDNQLGE